MAKLQVEFTVSPEQLAELFCEMSSEEQALSLQAIAKTFQSWGSGGDQQKSSIAAEFTNPEFEQTEEFLRELLDYIDAVTEHDQGANNPSGNGHMNNEEKYREALEKIAKAERVDVEHDDLFGENPDDAFRLGEQQGEWNAAEIALAALGREEPEADGD